MEAPESTSMSWPRIKTLKCRFEAKQVAADAVQRL